MKFFLAAILLCFSAGEAASQTRLLSGSQKTSCSEQEISRLVKELDEKSDEFLKFTNDFLLKYKNMDEKSRKTLAASSKPAIDAIRKSLHEKTEILEQCGVTYKSKKAREYAAENAQNALKEKRKSYDPEEALKPDL